MREPLTAPPAPEDPPRTGSVQAGPIALLLVLLAAYAASLGTLDALRDPARFDVLAERPHAVERLLVAERFADALPLVLELHDSYPREPLVAMWLARTHQALGHWREEAEAWEGYVQASPAAADACPALPEAYEHLGRPDLALSAFERCARFDPADPSLLSDLAGAYERRGLNRQAADAYRRASAIEPGDPVVRRHLAALQP